jgi:peptidoglycan hydrolase CwlO-like protein
LVKSGTREGELLAAKGLEKTQKGLADLKKVQEQLTTAIEKLDKQIEANNSKYRGLSPEKKQEEVKKEIAAKEREIESHKAQVKTLQKKYNELPANDATRPDVAKKLDEIRLEKGKHDAELEKLKNVFKIEEERAEKKERLEKTNEKIKKAGGSTTKKEEE